MRPGAALQLYEAPLTTQPATGALPPMRSNVRTFSAAKIAHADGVFPYTTADDSRRGMVRGQAARNTSELTLTAATGSNPAALRKESVSIRT